MLGMWTAVDCGDYNRLRYDVRFGDAYRAQRTLHSVGSFKDQCTIDTTLLCNHGMGSSVGPIHHTAWGSTGGVSPLCESPLCFIQ